MLLWLDIILQPYFILEFNDPNDCIKNVYSIHLMDFKKG